MKSFFFSLFAFSFTLLPSFFPILKMTLDISVAPRYFFLFLLFPFPPWNSLYILLIPRYRLVMIFIVESGSTEDCVYLLMNSSGVSDVDINTDSNLRYSQFSFRFFFLLSSWLYLVPWNCVKHLWEKVPQQIRDCLCWEHFDFYVY